MSVTEALAAYVVGSELDEIPRDVREEAKRALLNYLGCALGGSIEPALDVAIATLAPFSGERTACVLGRAERFDPLHASLMNGISSHVLRVRRHAAEELHPSERRRSRPPSSRMRARIPWPAATSCTRSCSASRSSRGSATRFIPRITTAAGTSRRRPACSAPPPPSASCSGSTNKQMVWAFGLAATQAAGIREMFGSMAKSFQPGRAAQNGYTAALLGRADFTAGEHGLEGPRGFAAVTAAEYDLCKITARLGTDFDLRDNTYKPFPCGIVVHPTIDGCIQLHRRAPPGARDIAAVRLRVAPLVLDLCNQRDITKRALQSKYSVYHAAAIGLVRGKGGLQEYHR